MTHVSTRTTSADRNRKRERERVSRQRRAANLHRMRHLCDALQRTALVVRTLDEPVWERFLGADAIRMRSILKLTNEARVLQIEQAELRRLMRERELSAAAILEMKTELESDDWDWNVARWRELANTHFQPWSAAMCQEETERSLKEVSAFQWRADLQSSGLRFFGWREQQRVDTSHGSFQFEFYKTFKGYEIMDYVNVLWDMFTDRETYQNVVNAHRFRADHNILQQAGPNIVIVRLGEQFPLMIGYVHIVYFVFRVKTETGFIQCVRSVCCPELMRVLSGENDVWPSNFMWFQWNQLERGQRGYKFRIGGCLRGYDVNYANKWMMEMFGCLLRSERLATRRELIKSGE